jgi:hypothetical protein
VRGASWAKGPCRALPGGCGAAKVSLRAVKCLPQLQQRRASGLRPTSAAPLPQHCKGSSVNENIASDASVAPILCHYSRRRGRDAIGAHVREAKAQRVAHSKGRACKVHRSQGLLVAEFILPVAVPPKLPAGRGGGVGLRGCSIGGPGEGAVGSVHCSALGDADAWSAGHQLQHKVGGEGVHHASVHSWPNVGAHGGGKVGGPHGSQRRGSVGRSALPGRQRHGSRGGEVEVQQAAAL